MPSKEAEKALQIEIKQTLIMS